MCACERLGSGNWPEFCQLVKRSRRSGWVGGGGGRLDDAFRKRVHKRGFAPFKLTTVDWKAQAAIANLHTRGAAPHRQEVASSSPTCDRSGGSALVQLSEGEGRVTPWTGGQSIHHTAAQRQAFVHSYTHLRAIQFPVGHICKLLDCGRNRENLERTHTDSGRTSTLHTQRGPRRNSGSNPPPASSCKLFVPFSPRLQY